MQGSSGTARRPRLRAAGVLLAAIGPVVLGLAGCSSDSKGGDTPSTPASASASASPSVTGPPVEGKAIDGEGMFKALTTAMTKAGGCTMKATIGAVSVEGTFSLGKPDEVGFPSSVLASGSVTSADAKKADFVADLGQRFKGTGFWVNDGGQIEGRDWALVPRNTSQLADPEGLIKTHPLYLLVPQAVPLVEPDNIATLMSVRQGLVKAADSTAAKPHYVWSVTGKPPVIGAEDTYQLWTDAKGRPSRFVGAVRGAPLEATYTGWGEQKPEAQPAKADIHELPVS